MENKFIIDLSEYNFKDISEESPQVDDICDALISEAGKLLGKTLMTDHWYDDGDGLTWESSYETDDEHMDECVCLVAKQKEVGGSVFELEII